MKLKLLPLAIGVVIAMPGVAAAAPTVYGKVNVTVENYDYDAENNANDYDRWEVNSNASRLGVKGSEKISDGLSAMYKLEYGVKVDDGDSVFSQRDIYGGLKGGFGEVIVGKFDTPLKKAQNKVDLFDNYKLGDISNVIAGENRTSNTIQYTTPDMGGISAKAAMIQAEGECSDDATNNGLIDCDDGLADGISASVAFEQDGIYLALGMDKDVESELMDLDENSVDDKNADVIRLVAQASIDALQLGFIYQTAEESDPATGATALEQNGYILSAAMKVGGDGKMKFQYGTSELDNEGGVKTAETIEITQIGLGYEHKLSKQTMLFTHYINWEGEQGSASNEQSTLALGMEHKF